MLRYIRDAPLANLAAEVVELEGRHNVLGAIKGLHDEIKAVARGMEGQKAACVEAIQALHLQMHTQADKPFVAICGRKRFKLYAMAVGSNDAHPPLWRTKCGVKFGQWAFTRHAVTHSFPEGML